MNTRLICLYLFTDSSLPSNLLDIIDIDWTFPTVDAI